MDLGTTRRRAANSAVARWWPLAVVAALALLWAKTVQTVYVNEGPFVWLGVDFRAYYTQALILGDGLTAEMYDLDTIRRYGGIFEAYSRVSWPLETLVVPYPPVFAGLVLPFTEFSPLPAFALWTLVNLIAAIHLARRIAAVFLDGWGRWAALLFLISFPVGYSLFLGQPMVLLAVAVAESFLALRAGRDFTAGVWIGVLLIKPQYGLLIGPLLLWKGRWRTVAGVATSGVVILLGSAIAGGLPGLLAYPTALFTENLLVDDAFLDFPQDMINWRMMLLRLGQLTDPPLNEDVQFVVTLLLSGLTSAVVFRAWRGPWAPRDSGFPARTMLLWLGTVLATYHSHAEGLVLGALPAASMLVQGPRHRFLGWALLAVMIAPTMLMLVLRMWFIPILIVQLLLLFGAVALECGLVRPRHTQDARIAPCAQGDAYRDGRTITRVEAHERT